MFTGARLAILASAVLVGVGLAGCAGGAPMPVPTYTPTATSSPGAGSTEPKLRPGQGAEANLPFFDQLLDEFASANGMGTSRGIVDALVAGGFEKADIEVTPDTTAINLAADSIIVSVRIKGECLVGQLAPGDHSSEIAPLLATGRCLVGETLPIDW
jgi:hypothetical protein